MKNNESFNEAVEKEILLQLGLLHKGQRKWFIDKMKQSPEMYKMFHLLKLHTERLLCIQELVTIRGVKKNEKTKESQMYERQNISRVEKME